MMYYKKLSTWINPEQLFQTLFAKETHAFWLDSSLSNDTARFSYMGVPQHTITYSLTTNHLTKEEQGERETITRDIFTYLQQQLEQKQIHQPELPFPFIGGYVGYFGYELKKLIDAKAAHPSPYPDSFWYFVDKTIVFDHKKRRIYLVCVTKVEEEATQWFENIKEILCHPEPACRQARFISGSLKNKMHFNLTRTKKQYLNDIATCKEYLQKGESYQICLTNKLEATYENDPLELYLTLRKINPAPYSAYIRYNDLAILCSSPEQFLTITQDRLVETKPIKGTVERGQTPEEDQQKIQQLRESNKEWAENAMIVDLLRNDLGKVCAFGSIHVTKQLDIESYATLHHLVSTIQGKLRPDVSIIDCIKACFPGGSMTGAPKHHTMEILDQLEGQARGIYSGSIGFLSFNNTAAFNIVIRTIIVKGNTIEIGAGGAILIDSDPDKEYEEMILKTKALRKALVTNYE